LIKKEDDQIYYSNWNQKLKEEHKDYWWMISKISEWIGNSLESSRSGHSNSPFFISTIGVIQTKEKFGDCRVYLTLACDHLVKSRYANLVNKIEKNNLAYKEWVEFSSSNSESDVSKKYDPFLVRMFEETSFPIEIPSYEDFRAKRGIEDAIHYRRVYFDAIKLWPKYEHSIRLGSSYSEYLLKDEAAIEIYYSERIASLHSRVAKFGISNSEFLERKSRIFEDMKFVKLISGVK